MTQQDLLDAELAQLREAIYNAISDDQPYIVKCKAALTLLSEIEARTQEPVAWMGEYNINDIRDHYTVVMRHKTDFDKTPDRVRPLYTTPQPAAVPDGWVLVPVEPTKYMLDAVLPLGEFTTEQRECLAHEYKTMIAAAPKEGGK